MTTQLKATGRQLCTICKEPSIPGLVKGGGKCQYHWNAGVYGQEWADKVKTDSNIPPQAQHTATRDDDDWILTGDEPEQIIEREGDGQTIAIVYDRLKAQRIVKAVNAHERLVEALRSVQMQLHKESCEHGDVEDGLLPPEPERCLNCKVNAALAEVQEKFVLENRSVKQEHNQKRS